MKTELFEIEPCLSPRLAWMDTHQIRTHFHDGDLEDYDHWTAWLPIHDFSDTCSDAFGIENEEDVGYGKTKDEAMISLAIRHKIPLWNEQPPSRPVE